MAATPAVITPDQMYYSVIAGSFRSIDNAEKKLSQLIDEGYPAALAQANPDGLYRVAMEGMIPKKKQSTCFIFKVYLGRRRLVLRRKVGYI